MSDEKHPALEKVLILSPTGRDAHLVAEALAKEAIESRICSTSKELCSAIDSGAGAAVIVAEEALDQTCIKLVNSSLENQAPWSDIPVILLTSSGVTTSSSYKTIRAFAPTGNVTLLERPFRSITLVNAVCVALRSRRRQHQIRDLLQKQIEATRLRDEFISIASHELKTPLTSMKLQFQFFQRMAKAKKPSAYNPEKIDNLMRLADQQIERLSRLIEDMLDASRIGTGKLQIEKIEVDLSELVRTVTERIEPQLASAGCTLKFEVQDRAVGVWDAYRIEQVISNLLSNAIKYAPGKPVEIKVQKNGQVARLSVKDRGPGVAPENRDRIFSRFERAASSENISGLGLGLYICKEIVKHHNGSIELQSAPGEGAEFSVILPLRDQAMS